jgi:effector-binding domain-containing protein
LANLLLSCAPRGASGGPIEAKARSRTWPYTCGIKDTEELHFLVRRVEGASSAEVEALVQAAEHDLQRAGRARTGPPMAVLRAPAEAGGDLSDPAIPVAVEVRVPVAPGTAAPEGFDVVRCTPRAVAYTIHHGRSDGLRGAEAVLLGWVKMKALRFAGETRRVYVKRGKNPKKDVTEVQIPLER